jgi:type II secretory pathway predicted ATPase ExeA
MYASHFGLSKRLFRSNPHGSDVFVGPQAAAVMTALKKALAAEDAVITVSGPVGIGKTTIVRRALENIGNKRIVITVGRMHLGYDEVIELLLAGLGARQLPKSMVHRFAMFRRLLQQFSDKGTRIFIVVEDATRIGFDALSELEALTAEDSGASSGASLVLMGTEGIAELLRSPELARLKQRVRLRQTVKPLDAGELKGYLRHCFRLAGGNFSAVFDAGCGETLHRLSDGTPRLANNIVEQALNTAAERNLRTLSVSFVERVAAEEIGLTAEHSVTEIRDALKHSAEVANSLEAGGTDLPECTDEAAEVDFDRPASPEETEDHAAILPPAATADEIQEPAADIAAADIVVHAAITEEALTADEGTPKDSAAATPAGDDVPDLIEDTLPDLAVLAPETSGTDTGKSELDSLFDDEDETDRIPTLFNSQRLDTPAAQERQPHSPDPESAAEAAAPALATPDIASTIPQAELPAWERDPTLAELRPDLEALERAMAVAQGAEEEVEPAKVAVKAAEEIPVLVPEITLDRQIQAKIDEATEALKQAAVDLEPAPSEGEDQSLEASLKPSEKVKPIRRPTGHSAAAAEPVEDSKARRENAAPKPKGPTHLRETGELRRVGSGLPQARSLDEVEDKMAETLFGEEFSLAAEVAASTSANDELQFVDDAPKAVPSRADGKDEKTNGHEFSRASGRPAPDKAKLDTKASERLATVRALNNGAAPAGTPPSLSGGESIVMAEGTSSGKPRKPEDMPLSIEDQINSATQTLKTLKIPSSALADNDDDDRPKGGFFSRFKRF